MGTPQNVVHFRGPAEETRLYLYLKIYCKTSSVYSKKTKTKKTTHLPAQNQGLLSAYPHPHNAPIFVAVVVRCCSNPRPDEPAVGENGTESC